MNSEDFKCNTCGDYVGEDGVWGLCDPCFDKEGGNEQLGKSLTIHNNSEFDRTDVGVKRTMRKYFLKHATEDVSAPDNLLPPPPAVIEVTNEPMQYAVEIVKPRVFDPPMKIKIVKAILAKQTPPK